MAPAHRSASRVRFALAAVLLALGACGGSPPPAALPTPVTPPQPLAALASQKIALTPVATMQVAPELGWDAAMPPARDAMRKIDDAIANALDARGIARQWVMPPALAASHTRNPTYSSDPYALAVQPLRGGTVAPGTKLTEPLASQLRMMVALHDDARMVLIPVQLRVAPDSAGSARGRATLSLVLVDPRFSEVRWSGHVDSDPASGFDAALASSLARHLADLVAAP